MKLNRTFLKALAWLVPVGLMLTGYAMGQNIEMRPTLTAQAPAWGIGREEAHIGGYLSPVCEADGYHSIAEYTEGEGQPPAWYRPYEPMAVEWEAPEAHPPVGIDSGGIDYNICSTRWGWDGHIAEEWEMELYARILYREAWGSSDELCTAVADAILVLWESGYYGDTLFETLSAVTEDGRYAFSTYPGVWEHDYDPDGLDKMRTLCMERFTNGYEYDAPFFRTNYFHPWAVDAYRIDNVCFSYSPWLN